MHAWMKKLYARVTFREVAVSLAVSRLACWLPCTNCSKKLQHALTLGVVLQAEGYDVLGIQCTGR